MHRYNPRGEGGVGWRAKPSPSIHVGS